MVKKKILVIYNLRLILRYRSSADFFPRPFRTSLILNRHTNLKKRLLICCIVSFTRDRVSTLVSTLLPDLDPIKLSILGCPLFVLVLKFELLKGFGWVWTEKG